MDVVLVQQTRGFIMGVYLVLKPSPISDFLKRRNQNTEARATEDKCMDFVDDISKRIMMINIL